RANLDGTGLENLLTAASVDGPGITLDVPNAELYWTNQDTGKVERANLDAASVQDVITSGLSAPRFIALDTSAPTETLGLAGGQTNPTVGAPINFQVVFSEPVVGFVSGVTLGGTAGATTVKITGSGTTYNVAISGMTQSGTITLAIPDSVASSLAGTPNTSSNSVSVQYNRPTAHLVITQKPGTTTVAGHIVGPSIIVQLLDASNHVITADNSDAVISVQSGPAGATILGSATVHAVNGVATFNDVILTKAGTYQLHIAYGNLATINTSSFTITPDATTSQLIQFQQPNPTVIASGNAVPAIFLVEDQYSNIITTDHSKITLTKIAGPGTLSGTTTVSVSKGKATFSGVKFSASGTYTVSAADASLAIATPIQFSQVATTVPAPKPAKSYTFGNTISLSATIKSPNKIAFTGVATITDQSHAVLGSVTLTAAGVAKFHLTGVTPGTHTAQINYPGDANHDAGTSPTFTLVVNTASTTTTLVPSATTLASGQALTLTANIATSTAPGTDRTGTVTFMDGATVLGSMNVTSNSAAWTIATPTLGHHSYKAVYNGDGNFKTSTSSSHSITVNKDNITVALTAPDGPFVPGETFNLTADVTVDAPGFGAPTGNIIFKDGSTVLGTIALASGEAVLNTSLLKVGNHTITASYVGDANSNAKTSPSLARVVDKAATTSVVTSPSASVPAGTNVTFTAVVSANSPAVLVPTGKVVFKDGVTTLATVTLAAGQAVFTTLTPLSAGDHSITATYLGDGSDDAGVSAIWTQSMVSLG
ncbi:MAG TPA: Ig-like domain repeat protein, partial [Phycisphaerae bacterium]